MTSIPKDSNLDSTLSLLKEGYNFLPNRRKKYESDIFKIRLMGKSMVCISGKEAAELFYSSRFKRKNALPKRIEKTLMGKNGVHSLDDEPHHDRKKMFMGLMKPEGLKDFSNLCNEYWHLYSQKWQKSDRLVLFSEAQEILTRIACDWAKVPLNEWEVKQRTRDLSLMVDSFGGIGTRHSKGKKARKRSEAWISEIVQQVQSGTIQPPKGSGLDTFAYAKKLNGDDLELPIKTVEVLNLIRPTVAVANFVAFIAITLHQLPQERKKIKQDPAYLEWFVQEIRRYYPFVPFLGAIVREPFSWQGYQFKPGKQVLLDIHGINRDPGIWDQPEKFKPERFKNWQENPHTFIPQGGGSHDMGHRCAGEWITIEALKVATDFLVNKIEYQMPDQDLNYPMDRLPTLPASGVVIKDVKVI